MRKNGPHNSVSSYRGGGRPNANGNTSRANGGRIVSKANLDKWVDLDKQFTRAHEPLWKRVFSSKPTVKPANARPSVASNTKRWGSSYVLKWNSNAKRVLRGEAGESNDRRVLTRPNARTRRLWKVARK